MKAMSNSKIAMKSARAIVKTAAKGAKGKKVAMKTTTMKASAKVAMKGTAMKANSPQKRSEKKVPTKAMKSPKAQKKSMKVAPKAMKKAAPTKTMKSPTGQQKAMKRPSKAMKTNKNTSLLNKGWFAKKTPTPLELKLDDALLASQDETALMEGFLKQKNSENENTPYSADYHECVMCHLVPPLGSSAINGDLLIYFKHFLVEYGFEHAFIAWSKKFVQSENELKKICKRFGAEPDCCGTVHLTTNGLPAGTKRTVLQLTKQMGIRDDGGVFELRFQPTCEDEREEFGFL
eukprot:TRINITY_DN121152_c0_g1_i1.p1 TRINITY_DN121152_c0_g1~~TRINITY_DN121152_c0_g1_i1.p1  ORF type:complete len:290 (-),score=63.94 TRINITY_DN121152_c0_g1_i1:300-1169(-)